jgi:hypothetical protein
MTRDQAAAHAVLTRDQRHIRMLRNALHMVILDRSAATLALAEQVLLVTQAIPRGSSNSLLLAVKPGEYMEGAKEIHR